MTGFAYFKGRLNKYRKLGSDCSGSSGDLARTLTMTKMLGSDSMVIVGGRVLHISDDYSVSGNVITFDNVAIDDTDSIMVIA